MKRRFQSIALFAAPFLFFTLFMVQAAAAGLRLEYELRDTSGQTPVTKEVHYYQNDFIKSVTFQDGRQEPLYTITDCRKGIIYFIDQAKKTYYTKTFDEMIAMMKRGAERLSQALKDMPPAMQAQFKNMLGGQEGKAVVSATDQVDEIAGYKARKYLITFKDMKSEVWISPELRKQVSRQIDSSRLDKFKEAFRGMEQDMSGGLGKLIEAEIELMKKEGEEVKRIQTFKVMGRTSTMIYQLVSAKEMDIPESEFKVPAGYKKVAAPY